MYKIHGNWNNRVYIAKYPDDSYTQNAKLEEKELIFEKTAYPENWESQYGMSTFVMNLNYFPKQLHNVVAPTDTRRRPDQRALELGNFIFH